MSITILDAGFWILDIKGNDPYLIPAKGGIFDQHQVSSIASPCQQHMFLIDSSVGGGASLLIINLTYLEVEK